MRTPKRFVEQSFETGPIWTRCGLTETEWQTLTTDQREIQYQRYRACDHAYVYPGIAGNKQDDRLREAYSFDPYAHTSHVDIEHSVEKFFAGTCECNTCVLKFGIEVGSERRKIDENELRERLRSRLQHVECVCDACWAKRP